VTRRAVLEQARDEGRAVSVEPRLRSSALAGIAVFEIYVPIYREGSTPPAVADRRALILGFVGGQYFVSDMLNQAIVDAPDSLDGISFTLYPKSQAEPARPTSVLTVRDRTGLHPQLTAALPPMAGNLSIRCGIIMKDGKFFTNTIS
jgi:hypothetical protein